MEDKELTPSESIALITSVIMEAKSRFRDKGFAFIFLGLCSFFASAAQFFLLSKGFYSINYYPYFIMPIAGVYTFYYYKKKQQSVHSKNIIGSVLSTVGMFVGLNTMLAGFLFWNKFGIALIPFMLILFAIWSVLTASLTKNMVFMWSGILINVIAFCTFFIDIQYHPLVLSIVSLVGLVVPGIILKYSQRENHV